MPFADKSSTSHQAIDALVCGYSASVRNSKILVMVQVPAESAYTVYVDESGGKGAGRILLLSACIQTYPVWSAFSEDWQEVLQSSPSISGFHVREARSRRSEFQGWKAVDVDQKIIALTEVIMRHEPHVFSCWISEEDHAATIGAVSPPDLKQAYFTCFIAILTKVAQYQLWRGITTPPDFVFDEKGDIGHEALMWYPAIQDFKDPELKTMLGSTPIFRNDAQVLPLQAADLIAWHKRRRKEIFGFDLEVIASSRIDELPGGECQITREALEGMAAKELLVPGIENARNGISCYKELKRSYRKRFGKRQ